MTAPLVCVGDFRKKAEQLLPKDMVEFIASGAAEEVTLRLNTEAFQRLRIIPRYFQGVTQVETACKILGCDVKWPLGISPSAAQKLFHADGEAGNAKAAGAMGSIYILSHYATTSLEDVAKAAPDTNKWLQIFICKDREVTEDLIRRAEKCNFKAIVLTVDQTVIGQRWMDKRNDIKLQPNFTFANFKQPTEYAETSKKPITLDDVKWLVNFTKLPVIVKGVLTAEGAILAQSAGCAGVIVSNHGARHLDGQEASIQALPSIVKAVGDKMVVMLDSGIRTGNDIFRALALGAKMVFIGRPALWGLTCGGEEGVKELLEVLRTDFVKVMTLAGCHSLKDVDSSFIKLDTANYN